MDIDRLLNKINNVTNIETFNKYYPALMEFLKIEVGPDHPVLLDIELFWQSQFIPDDVLMSMRGASSHAPTMNPSANPNFDMESFGKNNRANSSQSSYQRII